MITNKKAGKSIAFLAFLFCILTGKAQEIELSMNTEHNSPFYGQVSVLNWNEQDLLKLTEVSPTQWKEVLKIYTADNVQADQPQVLGSYSFDGQNLYFLPRFPPPPEMSYLLILNLELLNEITPLSLSPDQGFYLEKMVTTPKVDYPRTEVESVFPLNDTIPANLLRIYINFSASMGFDNPYKYLKLFDESHTQVAEPFVEVSEGLWDPERKRLTVLVHPGRIKRGVGPNISQGPVFIEGKHYSLEIDPNWKDSNGQLLGYSFEKNFYVTDEYREQLQIFPDSIQTPNSKTKDPLYFRFNQTPDRALIKRMVKLVDSSGLVIEGHIQLMDNHFRFMPLNNWLPGVYSIIINSKLEDISGNTLYYSFDSELESNASIQTEFPTYKIAITIE